MARRKPQPAEPDNRDAIRYRLGRLEDEIARNCTELNTASHLRDSEGWRAANNRGIRLWRERAELIREM